MISIPSRYSPDDFPFTPSELAIALAIKPDDTPLQTTENMAAQFHADEEVVWRVLYILIEFELFSLGEDNDDSANLP